MKTPKNIEIPNFEQKKNDPSLPMYEISEYPPPPPCPMGTCSISTLLISIYSYKLISADGSSEALVWQWPGVFHLHFKGVYGHVFFVQLLLVTSTIIRQKLKYLFSSLPCNTKFVWKRKNSTFSYCKTPKLVFCVSMK